MRRPRLTDKTKARIAASFLLALSFSVTGWLGLRSASESPPNASESAVLVVAAGMLQILSGGALFRVGRADPTHARSSVRRLQQVIRGSNEARRMAEENFVRNRQVDRAVVGQLSVHLSYIEECATYAVQDWMEFHGDALRDVVDTEYGQTGQGGSKK